MTSMDISSGSNSNKNVYVTEPLKTPGFGDLKE